jgi:ribosomal protein L16 Arg81 hydroxylase
MQSIEHSGEQVQVVEPPSREEFFRTWQRANRPVIFKGAVRHWKAVSQWNMDYLKSAIGDLTVPVEVSATGHFPRDVRNIALTEMPVREYIDKAILGDPGELRYYLSETPIQEVFPRLMDDLQMLPYVNEQQPPRMNLWFGAAGTETRLHYDFSHNLFVQLHGRKRFQLFSPGDSTRLYRYPLKHWYAHFSQVDITKPDFTRFPRFEDATQITCTLEPGDVMFLPVYWWHQPRCLDTSISVSMWTAPELKHYWYYRQTRWQFGKMALAIWQAMRQPRPPAPMQPTPQPGE